MRKNLRLVIFLLAGAFVFAGCGTLKGMGEGVAAGFETGVPATCKGAKNDAKTLAGAVMAADQWIKDNLW